MYGTKKTDFTKYCVLGDSTYVKFKNRQRRIESVVAEVKIVHAFGRDGVNVASEGAERTFRSDVNIYMIWVLVMYSQAEIH